MQTLKEIEPLADELAKETGEIWVRVFLPTIVFDGEEVKEHISRAKDILDRMGV